MAKRLTFHPSLFLGEGIAGRDLEKIKKQLHKKPLFANVYLIVPAANQVDQLDIYDAKMLAQPFYRNASICVWGIAADYTDAIKLVERMVQECLKETGDCRLREYLQC